MAGGNVPEVEIARPQEGALDRLRLVSAQCALDLVDRGAEDVLADFARSRVVRLLEEEISVAVVAEEDHRQRGVAGDLPADGV